MRPPSARRRSRFATARAPSGRPGRPGERGVALILTLLVLLILYAIVAQLTLSVRVDYEIARAEATLERMDRVVERVLYETLDLLAEDALGGAGGPGGPGGSLLGALGGGAEGAGAAGALLGGATAGGAGGGGGAPGAPPSDSFNDDWAKPGRKTVNGVEVTVLVEDENRKFNVLSILSPDEEFARASRDRLVRILDRFLEGTDFDLNLGHAETLARNLEEWMRGRTRTEDLPRPPLLSNDPNAPETAPLTIDELRLVEGFTEDLLWDRRVGNAIVPGLTSYLTVWTSLEATGSGVVGGAPTAGAGGPSTGGTGGAPTAGAGAPRPPTPTPVGGAGAGGGGAGGRINVNTASRVVLSSLLPESRFPPDIVERILRYRNELLDEDPGSGPESEYEEENPPKKAFATLEDLNQIVEFQNHWDVEAKQMFTNLLATQSEVFSVWITARVRPPGTEPDVFESLRPGAPDEDEGAGLVRRVRAVVWRRSGGEQGVEALPILRWEWRPDRRLLVPDFPEEEW